MAQIDKQSMPGVATMWIIIGLLLCVVFLVLFTGLNSSLKAGHYRNTYPAATCIVAYPTPASRPLPGGDFMDCMVKANNDWGYCAAFHTVPTGWVSGMTYEDWYCRNRSR